MHGSQFALKSLLRSGEPENLSEALLFDIISIALYEELKRINFVPSCKSALLEETLKEIFILFITSALKQKNPSIGEILAVLASSIVYQGFIKAFLLKEVSPKVKTKIFKDMVEEITFNGLLMAMGKEDPKVIIISVISLVLYYEYKYLTT